MDNYGRLGYVFFHQGTTSEETLRAKQSFEAYAKGHGVKIRQYHTDNGRFTDKAFQTSCEEPYQSLSFCGVNAHFQNGIAEKKIRDLQDTARTMLLHTQRRWPDAINAHLWPYAMRMASVIHNNSPLNDKKVSPIELFSNSTILPQVKQFHHFGCPTYVLDSALQAGNKIRKWKERARVGIYLGSSPQHAKSVALILSLTSGNVSPQFYCSFDDMFETTTGNQAKLMPRSQWQEKAHFKRMREQEKEEKQIEEELFTLPPQVEHQELVYQQQNTPPIENQFEPSIVVQPEATSTETETAIQPEQQPEESNLRRSTRERRAPARMADYVRHDNIAFEAIAELHSPETEWEGVIHS